MDKKIGKFSKGNDVIILELPFPPSVNRYYRYYQNRVLISREGRIYRKKVCLLIPKTSPAYFEGPVSLTIYVHPPDHRKRDLDNILKSLLDALEHARIYVNDSQVDEINIQRCKVNKPGWVEVYVNTGIKR